MARSHRGARELRAVEILPGFNRHAEGSALVKFGDTHVLCTASVEEKVPPHVFGTGKGWVTAEYGMLPRSTHTRSAREAAKGKQGGRTMEIQRLVGRALRAAIDPGKLGTRTIHLDCDVLQADGGTRTASITGAYVALALAVRHLRGKNLLKHDPLLAPVAAISVGVVDGELLLDLAYEEDSRAEVDLNLVATAEGKLIEVQGTAEGAPYSPKELEAMVALGLEGVATLVEKQRAVLAT